VTCGRSEGVKKKSQSLFDVHENQPRIYEGGVFPSVL
jgi:hypothetical protein